MKMKNVKAAVSYILVLSFLISCIPAFKLFANDNLSVENTALQNEKEFETTPIKQPAEKIIGADFIPESSKLFSYINAADFDADRILKRLDALERLDTYVFLNKDGTHTVYYLNEAVKFIDENGIIKEKDISLFPNLKGYSTFRNNIGVLLPYKLSDGISTNYEGYKVTVTPIVISPVIIGTKQDNSVIYDSAFGTNTALKYTPTLSGLKEDIILSEYNENISASYSFTIDTNGLSVYNDSDGYYLAESEKSEKVFSLGNVLAYDAMGKPEDGTMSVKTIEEGEEYILTLSVSESFLTDPETVYPVTIDPTLTVSDAVTSVGAIEDAPIYEGKPDSRFGSYIYNRVGLASEAYGVGRTVVRLPGLVNSPEYQSILSSSQIQSVTLNVIETSGGASQTVNVYPLLNPSWTESTVTWNNVGDWESLLCGAGTLKSRTFSSIDIKRMVCAWIVGRCDPACGFLIKSSNETVNKSFYSSEAATDSNKPYVVMTYLPKGNGGGDGFEDAPPLQAMASNSVTMNYRNEKRFFSFTPSTDGFYTFTSNASSCNANVQLYNSDKVLITQDGITSGAIETSSDFDLTYHLCANVKYYIAVGCAETSGSYTFKLAAEDDPGKVDNVNLTINLAYENETVYAYEMNYYKFSPLKDGLYSFDLNNYVLSTTVWLYNEDGEALSVVPTPSNQDTVSVKYHLYGGYDYYCVVKGNNYSYYDITVQKMRDLSILNAPTLNLNTSTSYVTYVRFGTKCYSFTPEVDGFYTISSTNSNGDPKVWLYTPEGEELDTNDDKSSTDVEFDLMYHLTAGKTYYFVFGFAYGFSGLVNAAITKSNAMIMDKVTITNGYGATVSVTPDLEVKVFKFIPTVTDFYTLKSANSYGYTSAWLYNYELDNLSTDKPEGHMNFSLTYHLIQGATYYYVIGGNYNDSLSCSVNLNYSDQSSSSSQNEMSYRTHFSNIEGSNAIPYKYSVYKFIPDVTTEYLFYSYNNVYDPKIWIYNNAYQSVDNDDNTGGFANFSLSQELIKDSVYYIVIGHSGADSGSFDVHYIMAPNIPNNSVFYIRNETTDMYAYSPGIDAYAYQYANNDYGTYMRWYFNQTTNGTYTIRSEYNQNGYLGITSTDVSSDNIKLFASETINTHWKVFVDEDSNVYLEPENAEGKMLSACNLSAGATGSNLKLFYVSSGNVELNKWSFSVISKTPLEGQKMSMWCWVTAARMFAGHYETVSSVRSQEQAVRQVKGLLINDGGWENEGKEAVEYYIDTNLKLEFSNSYGDNLKIFSENNVLRFLNDGHVIYITRSRYDNSGTRTGGHSTVIVGYNVVFYNCELEYSYYIYDPWPEYSPYPGTNVPVVTSGDAYERSYEWICNGRNANMFEDADFGIWEGFLVVQTEYSSDTIDAVSIV